MKPLVALHDAQARLLSLAKPKTAETVTLDAAFGRYLAAPLFAERTQPSADLSAMDGFAIAGDGPWQVVGESRCGAPYAGAIDAAEATQISTGAHMPDGADSIVLIEDAQLSSDGLLSSDEAPAPCEHIRKAGSDFRSGDELLASGTQLGPAQIALARMAGQTKAEVHQTASLTIIECGDELAADPASCQAHQIPATNGAMLKGMAQSEHCTISTPPPVADDLSDLCAAIDSVRDCDLLVISGGASVGDHDLVRPALEKLGATIDFWRVAMKPGKPLMIATHGDQLILGLPGNPVSSFVTGFLFMLPALRKILGASDCLPAPIMAKASGSLSKGGPRRTFLRAIYHKGVVTPLAQQSSGALGALAHATALIERAEHCDETKAGTYVPVYLLKNGGIA